VVQEPHCAQGNALVPMAKPTRQQRRARRREQAAAAAPDGTVAQRSRTRQAAVRPAAEAAPHVERRERRGLFTFIAECWGELKKVDWPNQRQVMTGTVAVIIACAIVGAYLYAADLVFRPFVERILLGN
jgi:preprotein translocase subunit SecE